MSKKVNIISYVANLILTLGALLGVVLMCNKIYASSMLNAVLKLLVGAIVAGLIITFAHELGHLIVGKANGFAFSSMTVWFFKFEKIKKKTKFSFVMLGDEAGYTQMIPTVTDNIAKRFKKMTMGGVWASLIMMLIGAVPFILSFVLKDWINVWVYSIWAMFFPIGAYFFFGSLFPASSGGMKNDGAIAYSIRKNTDSSKVMANILSIQAELYNGKTPKEIDESLYFDLPQLPEDDFYFLTLLNARYYYYLDKEDFENLKKVSQRINGILEYFPKSYRFSLKTDLLYNACAIDKDFELADDLMYELEKYLNKSNTVTNVRVKMAYLLYVKGETESLDMFYKKGVKEANKHQLKGLGILEKKLLDGIKSDIQTENVKE